MFFFNSENILLKSLREPPIMIEAPNPLLEAGIVHAGAFLFYKEYKKILNISCGFFILIEFFERRKLHILFKSSFSIIGKPFVSKRVTK